MQAETKQPPLPLAPPKPEPCPLCREEAKIVGKGMHRSTLWECAACELVFEVYESRGKP